MKVLINEILSAWKWVGIGSVFIALLQYLNLIFMAGVNPYFSNILVLLLLAGFIFLIFYIIKRKPYKAISPLAILIVLVLTVLLGAVLGKIFIHIVLYGDFTSSDLNYLPRRYYN